MYNYTTLLVFNNHIPEATFLRTRLHRNRYCELRVGRDSYLDSIRGFLPFLDTASIYLSEQPLTTPQSLFEFIKTYVKDIEKLPHTSQIIYYDPRFFPNQPQQLDTILQKAHYSELPVMFNLKSQEGDSYRLPLVSIAFKDLVQYSESAMDFRMGRMETIEVTLDNIVLDLMIPSNVLELFARNFQVRHFNALTQSGNYFVKSSTQVEKMAAEYHFFQNLPHQIRPFCPHVGTFEEKEGRASYQVEKIFILDASKGLINDIFSVSRMREFLYQIGTFLDTCPKRKVGKDVYKKRMRELFVNKLASRLHATLALPELKTMNHICGLAGYSSINALHEHLVKHVEASIAADSDEMFTFSHGDLCLTNILYDPDSTQLKLIDPKGGSKDDPHANWRPIWYDLAKLSHSFLGWYELLLYDLVDINLDNTLAFSIHPQLSNNYLNRIGHEFIQFIRNRGIKLTTLRLYEATLFISMLPLHRDHPKRMIGQLIQCMDALSFFQQNQYS
ncbi:hypothetical protein TI05_01890 [Achromatium sp. WMS3]|nr:hypothetical protein TI05_01890 [Achromatium sp. WMS3]